MSFSQILQAGTAQTMLPSVTISLRLCLTDERSEMSKEVLGSVPDDLPQHLTIAPLLSELGAWLCVSPCQTSLPSKLREKAPSLGYEKC